MLGGSSINNEVMEGNNTPLPGCVLEPTTKGLMSERQSHRAFVKKPGGKLLLRPSIAGFHNLKRVQYMR